MVLPSPLGEVFCIWFGVVHLVWMLVHVVVDVVVDVTDVEDTTVVNGVPSR